MDDEQALGETLSDPDRKAQVTEDALLRARRLEGLARALRGDDAIDQALAGRIPG
jgi:hypothetical protein